MPKTLIWNCLLKGEAYEPSIIPFSDFRNRLSGNPPIVSINEPVAQISLAAQKEKMVK